MSLALAEAEQGTSLWADAWLRLKKNRLAMFGLCVLVVLICLSLITPWIAPYGYEEQNLMLGASAPSMQHWLGTDVLGRDLFTRLLYGGRVSLAVGFIATGVALVIGVLWGTVAGYVGGKVDAVMMRIVDILYALPFIIFIVLLMVVFGRNILLLFMAIGAVEWLTMARIVRGQVQTIRQQEYIEAAVSMGLGPWAIIRRHVIPNTLGPVIVYTTLTIPSVMLLEAFLSFLGLGIQPPQSSWGLLISYGVETMEEYPWLLIFPGLALSLTLFSLNFLGDGLRDALDPRVRVTEMALLSVKHLGVSFHTRNGVVKAVEDLSFNLEAAKTLAIVGESGSGKSVACYSLLGLVPSPPGRIDNGTAHFNGEDLLNCSDQHLRALRGNDIAMIFQDPMTCLNPYLSIGEQLIEPLLYHRQFSRSDARLRGIELLQDVGIDHPQQRFDSYPHQLSGGQRQRVMIAMALINEPKLIIADEPTTALDVTIQAQILRLLKELQDRYQMALIFVSHDLAVVSDIADEVLVMCRGETVEYGSKPAVLHQPQAEYTRQLLAAVPSGAKPVEAAQSQQALVEVSGLKTWFEAGKQTVKAVDDVSFTINQGEILGLVGESGSGKSTLGRSLLGLVKPSGGKASFAGQSLVGLSNRQMLPLRPKMQMIFQDPFASLNPRMTVFDTLAEPLLYHGMASRSDVAAQVQSLMDEVGLARAQVRKYPHEFSGGQRQRIAIGRAIATRPEFIVADEPVSALDVTIQAQILELILHLVDKHRLTMLFISHDMAVVRYLCDRVMVMHQGRLIETGATEQVFHQPAQQYTRNLLAAVPGAGLSII